MTQTKDKMAVHYSSAYDKWQTPRPLVARLTAFFGGRIELDPCTDASNPTGALVTYTGITSPEDDGLMQPWIGASVYVNPPYGTAVGTWVAKALVEMQTRVEGEIILLLPARTDTRWFLPLHEQVVCYLRGRLRYTLPEAVAGGGSTVVAPAPFPSCLVYLGPRPVEFALSFADLGAVSAPFPRRTVVQRRL